MKPKGTSAEKPEGGVEMQLTLAKPPPLSARELIAELPHNPNLGAQRGFQSPRNGPREGGNRRKSCQKGVSFFNAVLET
jgi:hypothetical protein